MTSSYDVMEIGVPMTGVFCGKAHCHSLSSEAPQAAARGGSASGVDHCRARLHCALSPFADPRLVNYGGAPTRDVHNLRCPMSSRTPLASEFSGFWNGPGEGEPISVIVRRFRSSTNRGRIDRL